MVISNTSLLDAGAVLTCGLQAMNSDGRVKGIGLLVPDVKPLRNKECTHHWLIGPPTYSHDGLIEDTDWECKLCGEKKHNTLLCPFNEVQDEWVKGLF